VRSEHFFEAAGVVAELRASLARTHGQVLDMRAAVRAVDGDVVQAAATVQVCVPVLRLPGPAGYRASLHRAHRA
jgi:hypothetical protein